MQYETPPNQDPLPEESTAVLRTTQALLSELALGSPLLGLLCYRGIVSRGASPGDVVKREFDTSWNVLQGKEAQVVQVLIGSVGYHCHDSKVRLARVIDEAGGSGHKLSVDFVGFSQFLIVLAWVGEFIHRKEIEVLAMKGLFAAAIGFLRGDDLANIFINKLAFANVILGTNTYRKG